MKKILSVLLCVAVSQLNAQLLSKVSILPERPEDKATIQLVCYPSDSIKKAGTPVQGVAYVYDTLYNWHVYDLSLHRSGDTSWNASFPLPAGTAFVAYKFSIGDHADNNEENGYYSLVFTSTGEWVPGARAAWGLFRSPRYGLGIPGYFEHFSISDSATYLWMNNEIRYHHGSAVKLVVPYVHSNLAMKKEAGIPEVNRAVNYLLSFKNDTTEVPLLKAWYICTRYLKDSSRGDSIHAALLLHYPAGYLARYEAYNKAIKAKTVEDRFSLAKQFIQDFPYHEQDEAINTLLGISYYNVYRNALAIAIAQKQTDILYTYQNTLPFRNIPEAYYKAVEIPYDDWKSMDAKTAFPLSDVLYQRMRYYYDHQPAEYWYYSPIEWKVFCDKQYAAYYRLHARILMETGKAKEAMPLAKEAQQVYQYRNTDLNQTEATLLSQAGATKQLDTLLRESVRKNQLTASMIALLQKEYVKRKGNNKGFDEWLESLKDAKTMELMREDIRKYRVSKTTPSFLLDDNSGRQVSLESLKGKVVVIDFWATWCAPCKAAMAGMQMAQNKYSKDTNVVFLFIDTQERDPDYKAKGKSFLQEKGYAFHVLYDTGETMDQTYHAMNTGSGIPCKVVIDAKGVIRYTNVGYKGSPSGLSDEISTMIELTKLEK